MSKAPNLHEIIPHLYLGSLHDARLAVASRSVTHVLTVCETSPLATSALLFPPTETDAKAIEEAEASQPVKHLMISISDVSEENLLTHLPATYDFIDEALSKDCRIIVHCHAGISRSTSVVAAYLMRKNKIDLDDALSQIRKVRSFVAPNQGFLDQLLLFQEMNYTIDNSHIHYRQLMLKRSAKARLDGDLVDTLKDLAVDPEKLVLTGKRLRCKKCRRVLVQGENIVPHEVAERSTFRGRKGEVRSDTCTSWFVEPVAWMNEVVLGNLEGNLNCPKCETRLGNFAWAGMQCSCSAWITPAFQLKMAKVDFM